MVKTSIFFVFLASLDTQGPIIGVISFCLRFAFAKIKHVLKSGKNQDFSDF